MAALSGPKTVSLISSVDPMYASQLQLGLHQHLGIPMWRLTIVNKEGVCELRLACETMNRAMLKKIQDVVTGFVIGHHAGRVYVATASDRKDDLMQPAKATLTPEQIEVAVSAV